MRQTGLASIAQARSVVSEAGLGTQIVLDLYDCDAAALDDLAGVEGAMLEAARAARATIITQNFHRFAPWGISGVVVIAESHLAIHTWPERHYAAVDVFTCGPMGIDEACRHLIAAFGSRRQRTRTIARGDDF
jgi:S-adenosylmethionine decarboxylase